MIESGNGSFKCAGFLGARLRPGRGGNPAMCGDSILIDPARGLFAVGDSSDREPRAARAFMRHFSELLDDISILPTGGVVEDDRLDAFITIIVDRSHRMMRELPLRGSTTFTGVLLVRTGRKRKALLLHAGDSILLAYRPGQGMRTVTEKNFWLIGKAREFYQTAVFDVSRGDRFLLATDGIQDLTPPAGKERDAYLAELFTRSGVEDIPDILIGSSDTKTAGTDDLAVLTLAPDRPFPDFDAIILGVYP